MPRRRITAAAIERALKRRDRRRRPRGRGGISFTEIRDRIKGFFTGRTKMPPDVRAYLERNAARRVVKVAVARQPIVKLLQLAADALSEGEIGKSKKALGYDDLFHLYLLLFLDNGLVISLEKVHTVKISGGRFPEESGSWVELGAKVDIPLPQFVANVERIEGDRTYYYNLFDWNCQRYVTDALNANGLLTPELSKWINQDAAGIVKTSNWFTRFLANHLPSLGNRLDVLLRGTGRRRRRLR